MRRIIIHSTEPGEEANYWVECPSLGIASQGDTIEEAIAMIKDAIQAYIEVLEEHGDPVPVENFEDQVEQVVLIEV